MTPPREPLFSVVSACYQVAAFLPEFIASVDAQTIDASQLEIVMVDDGSSDETGAMLDAWASRRPGLVRVIHQQNAGQGPARNAGLEVANGDWITFPDPDDVLAPDYFEVIQKFVEDFPNCDMVAGNRWFLDDTTGESSDLHPLRHLFHHDARRNLAIRDRFFHGSASAAFFRHDRLVASGHRFDPRIRPNFGEAHFCSQYLLESAEPMVGFAKSAVYHRRRSPDGTSTRQNSLSDPSRYTAVLRLGPLALLLTARLKYGYAPLWLQNLVLHELNHYVGQEDAERRALAPAEVRDEFHVLMSEITAELDHTAIQAYNSSPTRSVTRDVLNHAWTGERWTSPEAVILRHDEAQGLVQLMYRFVGERPREQILWGEKKVTAFAAKTRDVMIQGRAVMHERILWVPTKRLRLRIDDQLLPIARSTDDLPELTLSPRSFREPAGHSLTVSATTAELNRSDRATARTASSRRSQGLFAGAWVLMDRVHNSDDSAEHLFSFLRRRHPQVNAWFVVESGTSDFVRLRKKYGGRVVSHGSVQWKSLMINADYLISSHADIAVVDPPALRPFGRARRRFVFLQHGVTKDDLSGWLNNRDIDLCVTSTHPEHQSIVADHTAYRYTAKEVALTGLPRFDRLFRAGARYPPARRDLVLFSPTWRNDLVAPLATGSQRRVALDGILDSQYMRAWSGLINDSTLAESAHRHGLRVAVLPHPNMDEAFDQVALPTHVQRLSFEEAPDIRALFARAAVLVTDYSSTAFDAAYISRPVVYYQFDAEPEGETRHVGLVGYHDYTRDGFGPVTHTHDQAVAEIIATLDHGHLPRSPWAERMATAFAHRDARNCERVVARIRAMERRAHVTFERE